MKGRIHNAERLNDETHMPRHHAGHFKKRKHGGKAKHEHHGHHGHHGKHHHHDGHDEHHEHHKYADGGRAVKNLGRPGRKVGGKVPRAILRAHGGSVKEEGDFHQADERHFKRRPDGDQNHPKDGVEIAHVPHEQTDYGLHGKEHHVHQVSMNSRRRVDDHYEEGPESKAVQHHSPHRHEDHDRRRLDGGTHSKSR